KGALLSRYERSGSKWDITAGVRRAAWIHRQIPSQTTRTTLMQILATSKPILLACVTAAATVALIVSIMTGRVLAHNKGTAAPLVGDWHRVSQRLAEIGVESLSDEC